MRWAVVQDGTVVNVIEWDGIKPYQAAHGTTLVQHDEVGIGWTYENGELVAPIIEVVNNPDPNA